MLNASILLHNAARFHGQTRHLHCEDASLSYKEAETLSGTLALQLLRLGIAPGDYVALFCPNSIQFVLLYFAVLRLGGIVVPLNVMLKRMQIYRCLEDCGPQAVVCAGFDEDTSQFQEVWEGFKMSGNVPLFARLSGKIPEVSFVTDSFKCNSPVNLSTIPFPFYPTSAEDACCVIYTSGTTGQPKGVELSHSNLVMLAYAFSRHMFLGTEDRVLAGLPLFSSFGQTATMCATLLSGGDLIILPRFSGTKALEAIKRHAITFFGGVPTMIHGVLHAAESSGINVATLKQHWRLSFAGGAAASASLLDAFRETFDVPIVHGYGSTETSAVSSFNPPMGRQKDASVGVPLWGVTMRVVNEDMDRVPLGERGELVISGPHIMRGYHNNEAANQEVFRGGWLHTGDIAEEDEDGYFYIVGRLKEMILRGGQNVYPHDVEEILAAHPCVDMAAVLGIPDERLGEEIAAFVLLKKGVSTSEDELMAWCKERLPAFAYPRIIQIRDTLPIGPTGKILKKDLYLDM
jgi:long-chain acyl-CoA synthetase